jgi:tetratricopeptide (TPR) repeat protein
VLAGACSAAVVALGVALYFGVVRPAEANVLYARALTDPSATHAYATISEARADDPSQAVMAVAAGNIALAVGGPDATAAAVRDFEDAARLGELGDAHWIALARLDAALGRRQAAVAAARAALAANPFDPQASQLLAALGCDAARSACGGN